MVNLQSSSGSETVLYSFSALKKEKHLDGMHPSASLIPVGRQLFGTTLEGGNFGCDAQPGCGTVFSIERK
jgi:hypothetical protein